MGSLPTGRATPGTSMDAPSTNTIFTDIAVATADLDAANVRSEAVDIGQLDTVITSGVGLVTRHVDEFSGGAGTYANGADRELMRSTTQFALRIGDVLRAYVSVNATATAHNAGHSRAQLGDLARTSGAAWVLWLEYDITDATLTNWVPVPGTDAWGTYFANVVDNAAAAIGHIRTAQTSSVLVFPHLWVFQRSPAASTNPWAAFPMTDTFCRPIRRTRAYHHERTGTNTTVYGMRLMCRGVVSLGKDPNGSGAGLMFLRDTASISGNPRAFSDDTITFDAAKVGVLVQAKE